MNTPNPINVTFDIGDGRMVTLETGKLARQADGAVTVRLGNCIILATVVAKLRAMGGRARAHERAAEVARCPPCRTSPQDRHRAAKRGSRIYGSRSTAARDSDDEICTDADFGGREHVPGIRRLSRKARRESAQTGIGADPGGR